MFPRRLAAGAAALAWMIVACAPEARLVPIMTGPDGSSWIAVHCQDHVHCLQQAAFFCPEGYRIDERDQQLAGTYTRTHGETHTEESMLVQCKSCTLDRAVLVDDAGHMTHDPNRHEVARICRGE